MTVDKFLVRGEAQEGKWELHEAMEVQKTLIVVEVPSPSTASYDLRDRLAGYFQRPTTGHYLIVDTDKRQIIHHRRGQGDELMPDHKMSDSYVLSSHPGFFSRGP